MTWQVLTRSAAGTALSLCRGPVTLAVSQRVKFTARGESIEGRIERFVLVSSGYTVHVRTERGTYVLEPEEIVPAPKELAAADPLDPQALDENLRRMRHEAAASDLKLLRESGASYQAVIAAAAKEEALSRAE